MTRIPLATDLKTRTSAPDKDARLKNAYIEGKGNPQSQDYQTIVRKRPSATGGFPVGSGIAQGGIGSPTGLTVVTADTLNTTITSNTALTSQTNVIAAGSPTITLPTSPTLGQSVSVCNIGSGTVTVSPTGTTIPAWTCSWFIWGGFSWGISFGPTCTITFPSSHDFGTIQYAGPSGTPYSVPATTVTYTTIGITPCGGSLRQISTKTYSSRQIDNQLRGTTHWNGSLPFASYVPSPFVGDVFVYGNTAQDVAQYAVNLALSQMAGTSFEWVNEGTPPPARDPVTSYDYIEARDFQNTPSAWVVSIMAHFTLPPSIDVLDQTSISKSAVTLGTVYFLDVHEVWTYDVI